MLSADNFESISWCCLGRAGERSPFAYHAERMQQAGNSPLRRLLRFRRVFELEQGGRVKAPNLFPVNFAEARIVKPASGMIDVLERPVGREQDAVCANL